MFTVRIKGESRLYRAIDGLADRLSDFRRRWSRHIKIRRRHQREWMDTRGRGSWPKLTDEYLERKSQDPRALFVEVLKFTGHLYRSLVEPKAPDSVIDAGRSKLIMGTSDPKARIHHEGRGRAPVRRVMFIGDDEVREHQQALYESVAEAAREEAFKVVAL